MFSMVFSRLSLMAQNSEIAQPIPDTIAASRPYFNWVNSPFWLVIVGMSLLLTILFFYGLIRNHRSSVR